ncbi:MAG: class I SAM-dependent methyltransferase [Chloroflexi bacterium]|nr:class I SAM-dependent methyltransferase [Chloroflexota bacterium]
MDSAELPWELPDAVWESMVGPFLSRPASLEQAAVEVDAILSLTSVAPSARVLDLCCGMGRHALELARRGFSVTGVDRTVKFLDQARQQAREEGLTIEFLRQDMRAFRQPNSFDMALNLNTSFGYFEDPADDLQVIRNIHASLLPGGILVLQTIGKEVLARIFQERDWSEIEGSLFLQERRPAEDWGRMDVRWIKITSGQREEWSFTHRLFAATELAALMREAGFQSVKTYGDLEGGPYDNTARKLVIVAQKA